MTPRREIRYRAGIPRILLTFILVLMCLYFVYSDSVLLMSPMPQSIGDVINNILLLSVMVLCALGLLQWLVALGIVRGTLLTVDHAGFRALYLFKPWRSKVVPWEEVTGLGVRKHRLKLGLTRHYFVADVRDASKFPRHLPALVRLLTKAHPSPVRQYVALASLNMIWLFATRKRQAQMLERIKTTFAPEIYQYQIQVDDQVRPI